MRFSKGLLLASFFALGASVFAGPYRNVGSVLYVNEVPVLRISVSAGGFTPDIRCTLAVDALERTGGKGLVTVKKSGEDEMRILVGDEQIVTVTKEDARRNRTDVMSLAGSWCKRIREALDLPALQPSRHQLDVPVGAVRNISIVGSKVEDMTIDASAVPFATVKRTAEGLQFRAMSPGVGRIRLRSGGDSEGIDVIVRPWAANFPQKLDAEVIGVPAAGSTVGGAIATVLKTQLKGVAGAVFSYKVPNTSSLATGQSRTYTINVRAEGRNAVNSYGPVTVVVKNVPLARRQDAELWYSNNPEVVRGSMPLFSATLRPDVPARLLYHHVNAATQPMYIRVQAVNPSDDPARIVVIPGDSKPDLDPVRAGMAAASQYFRAWTTGSGELITIPPHSTLPISLRRLSPGETSSGLCGLRLMPGSPELLVRTDSWPPFDLAPEWRAAIASSTPWREVGCPPINDFDRAPYEISDRIFPNPNKTETMKYEVGGRYGMLKIGQRAIVRPESGSRLDGNFGVIYSIKAAMQNPTHQPTDVEVVFEASAGYTGGLFMVNGSLLQTPPIAPKMEKQIARYHLDPGATRYLDITTLPLSGSSYPATLTIRPLLDEARPMQVRKPKKVASQKVASAPRG